MALAKRLKELLEALEMDLETYLKKHYELFEAVDTGYVAKDGRTHFTELIYHGHSHHVCRYCQRGLKKKNLRLVKRQKPCSQRPVQGGGGRRRQFVRAVGVQLRVQALRQTPACAARFRGALAAPYPVYRCPYPFTCV